VTQIFDLSFLLVAPFWLLMILVPRLPLTRRVIRSPFIAVGPALIYLALVLPDIASILPLVVRPALEAIAALLGTPRGATIGWQHFLAFDLLVARMIYLYAEPRGVPQWQLSPVLLLTLLLGPIGYLASLGWWARNAAPKVAPAQE
jgi:hypothetical protein